MPLFRCLFSWFFNVLRSGTDTCTLKPQKCRYEKPFLFLVLLVFAACNSQGPESENNFDAKKKLIEDRIWELGLDEAGVSIPDDVDPFAFLNADINIIFQRLEIFASDKQKERENLERMGAFKETIARDSTLSPEEKKKKLEKSFPELIRGGGSQN